MLQSFNNKLKFIRGEWGFKFINHIAIHKFMEALLYHTYDIIVPFMFKEQNIYKLYEIIF
jgi:hypothetical protein